METLSFGGITKKSKNLPTAPKKEVIITVFAVVGAVSLFPCLVVVLFFIRRQ